MLNMTQANGLNLLLKYSTINLKYRQIGYFNLKIKSHKSMIIK